MVGGVNELTGASVGGAADRFISSPGLSLLLHKDEDSISYIGLSYTGGQLGTPKRAPFGHQRRYGTLATV